VLGGGIATAADRNPGNRNAQEPAKASKEVVQDVKTITDSGTTKTTTDTIYGKVEAYDSNKSLKMSVPGKVLTSKSFDLTSKNETINVAPGVKVGDWVKAQEKTDNSGHKTLTIERWHEQGHSKPRRTLRPDQVAGTARLTVPTADWEVFSYSAWTPAHETIGNLRRESFEKAGYRIKFFRKRADKGRMKETVDFQPEGQGCLKCRFAGEVEG
jgi:hypothetical protein